MTYLIVAGVDGSEGGRRALAWAVREAASRGGTVQAVAAWRWDGIETDFVAVPNAAEEKRRTTAMLAQEISQVTRGNPPVPVAAEVVEGRPADVLSAAGRGADLLVLGSHGHSRIRHTVLGSVSEECVRKASCPVVVIPVPAPEPAEPAEPVLRA
ncbi:universal stress protein [Plantactinospora sp. GCM10030261]|uniref:universal stress protein n=1 Tax=Plantactinospora sp. GCM10030261 TaxID=3273420 RepID=UPI003616D8C8